jgi:hypothetical protein
MSVSQDLPSTVDFGNNLVNYIEVSADHASAEQTEPSGAPAAKDHALSGPTDSQVDERSAGPRAKVIAPVSDFSSEMPRYLLDFEEPEDSSAYQHAINAIDKLPSPPSLPGFLGKPILNANTLLKDDNSVLNMPNHTVLNHLATSSIKHKTLAVSATTRYKSKVRCTDHAFSSI